MTRKTVGFAMCGSFCTFSRAIPQIEALIDAGYDVLPIMSYNASTTDTRFGKAQNFIDEIEEKTKQGKTNKIKIKANESVLKIIRKNRKK